MEISQEQFNNLLTKEDGEKFATKEDLKAFATKEEMNARFDAAFEYFASNQDLQELKGEVVEVKNNVEKILSVVEGLATSFQRLDNELTANVGAHDRIDEKVEIVKSDVQKIDIRVKKLESVA